MYNNSTITHEEPLYVHIYGYCHEHSVCYSLFAVTGSLKPLAQGLVGGYMLEPVAKVGQFHWTEQCSGLEAMCQGFGETACSKQSVLGEGVWVGRCAMCSWQDAQ